MLILLSGQVCTSEQGADVPGRWMLGFWTKAASHLPLLRESKSASQRGMLLLLSLEVIPRQPLASQDESGSG